MKKMLSLAGAAMVGAALAGAPAFAPAFAQGAAQSVGLVKVDVRTVATGYRSSKIVGSTVVNEANETVGKVDDLIVTPDNKVPFAILSVGGFLGVCISSPSRSPASKWRTTRSSSPAPPRRR